MNKNEWKKWVGVLGRMLLAYALVFAQGAWATQSQATKDKPASPQKAVAQQANEKQSSTPGLKAQSERPQSEESEGPARAQKRSRNGAHEGITVHGHWTIEVRNPDGAMVRHVEFENSLDPGYSWTNQSIQSNTVQVVPGGASYLAALLTGQAAAPNWGVVLVGPAGLSNPFPASTANAPCVRLDGLAECTINVPSACGSAAGVSCNLSVSTSGTAPNLGPIQVSGSVAATQNGQVSTVVTTTGTHTFTSSTNFPGAPISVSAGQTIAVTVVISFS